MAEQVPLESAVQQIVQQGGTPEHVNAFLKSRGFQLEAVSPGVAMGIDRPLSGVGEMEGGLRAPRREALAQLHIDPAAGEVVGGLTGGVVAAPFAVAAAPSIVGPPAIEMAGVGFGAALGRAAVDLWNEHVVGEKDTRSPLRRAIDTTLTAGTNAAFQGAGAAAGKVAGAAWTGLMNGVRKFFGGGTEESVAALKAFRDAGVAPTFGGVGNAEAKGVERGLARMPGGAGRIETQLDRVRSDLTASFGKAADSYGEPVTEMATAGEAARGGAQSWVANKKDWFENAYAGIKGLGKVQVDMDPVQQEAQQVIDEANKGLGDTATLRVANRVLQRANGTQRGPGIDFAEGVKLRSDLLELGHSGDQEVAGAAQAAAKRLAGVLDQSMQAGAEKAATQGTLTPSDFSRWRAVNADYAKFREDLPIVAEVARGRTGEEAFKAAFAGSADGPTRLKVVKDALADTPGAWDSLVSYKLGEMPLEKAGHGATGERAFSPDQFLTNWRAIKSEDSKTLLFGPKGDGRRDALDSLVETVGRLKATNAMANPSGTAGQLHFMNWLSGGGVTGYGVLGGTTLIATGNPLLGGMAVAAGIGTPVSARLTASLVENERFLRWFAQAAKLAPTDATGLAAHMGRLVGIVKAEPALRGAVQQYLDGVQLLLPPAPTMQDRVKQGAQAAGLAPRPSAARGAGSMAGTRG